ncbi:hypothetical protein GUJ93_ZPchr0006g46122 [Zizania palustris]|uniref:Uncharacterized protein n=1 Tax=Zizania palustris TaxID=103762 RepID=A0A8J5SN98_ZIZPA|nr:hypothetical protein GUJ93_ZPchr0006g46122 [Zizania palustris]
MWLAWQRVRATRASPGRCHRLPPGRCRRGLPTPSPPRRPPRPAASTAARLIATMKHSDHEHDHVAPFDFFTQPTTTCHPIGKIRMEEAKKCPPENLGQLEQMFDQMVVDGSSSCIPGKDNRERCDERIDVDEFEEFDDSPISANTRKRTSSTNTSVTSLTNKTKSPMVNIMRGVLENLKANSVVAKKVLQRDTMASSMKKALQMVVQCGAAEESIEYFMASQLFVKAENREIFFNFSTDTTRLIWLKRWCQLRKMY